MAIFNSYVKLPKGIYNFDGWSIDGHEKLGIAILRRWQFPTAEGLPVKFRNYLP